MFSNFQSNRSNVRTAKLLSTNYQAFKTIKPNAIFSFEKRLINVSLIIEMHKWKSIEHFIFILTTNDNFLC